VWRIRWIVWFFGSHERIKNGVGVREAATFPRVTTRIGCGATEAEGNIPGRLV
jgi:hypothetical protein